MERVKFKRKVDTLQNIATNVVLEILPLLDLHNNRCSDVKKFGLCCDMVMNIRVQNHGLKELKFDQLFSKLDSDNGERTSAIFIAFMENVITKPYKETESISLTLTEHMLATKGVNYDASMAAKTLNVIRTIASEYKSLHTLLLYVDRYETFLTFTTIMEEKYRHSLLRILKLEVDIRANSLLDHDIFLEIVKNISNVFCNVRSLNIICTCRPRIIGTNFFFAMTPTRTRKDIANAIANVSIDRKAFGTFPSLNEICVEYNNIEEIMGVEWLCNVYKIGVRLNHGRERTAVEIASLQLLTTKTKAQIIELIFCFSSEDDIFPKYGKNWRIRSPTVDDICDCATKTKLTNIIVAVEIDRKRVFECNICNMGNVKTMEVEKDDDEKKDRKYKGKTSEYVRFLKTLESKFDEGFSNVYGIKKNEIRIPFCLTCEGLPAVLDQLTSFPIVGRRTRCHIHYGISWPILLSKKICEAWDSELFRSRLRKGINMVYGSLVLDIGNICQFNAILQYSRRTLDSTLPPLYVPDVYVLEISYDDIERDSGGYICGYLSDIIVEVFPNLTYLKISIRNDASTMFWKKSNTYKMISDEETIGIWKYLEEIKVMFSGVLFDICRVSPSLEKVGVIFGYEHITPCRLINLLKLTHPLKRGMEFIFDLRICNEQIGRRIIKYYTCLLYTSDAADERSSVDLGGRRIIKKKMIVHTR